MSWIAWIVLGLIAGAIAKAIMKDKAPGGFLATLILGLIGALLGGWIGGALFGADMASFWSPITWLWAIIGSVIVLFIYGALTGRKRA